MATMTQETMTKGSEQTWRPAPRAFFVCYVAFFLCFLGPLINPEAGLPLWLGVLLGLGILVMVAYRLWGQEYRVSSRGLSEAWKWPARQEEIPWQQIGDIQVRRGLTQSLLNVGNLVILDKTGRQQMLWYGLADPKGVKAEVDARRT